MGCKQSKQPHDGWYYSHGFGYVELSTQFEELCSLSLNHTLVTIGVNSCPYFHIICFLAVQQSKHRSRPQLANSPSRCQARLC